MVSGELAVADMPPLPPEKRTMIPDAAHSAISAKSCDQYGFHVLIGPSVGSAEPQLLVMSCTPSCWRHMAKAWMASSMARPKSLALGATARKLALSQVPWPLASTSLPAGG